MLLTTNYVVVNKIFFEHGATTLDKINGTSGPPLPPQNGAKWGGGWGIIVPFYSVQDCSNCFSTRNLTQQLLWYGICECFKSRSQLVPQFTFIMVIELSGVQFCLKSQLWFQTKIARPEFQLPLYCIHFEITQFIWIDTRTTRFWSVPLYIEPTAKHLILKICQRHVNVMWLLHVIGCFALLSYSHWLRKKMRFRAKNSAICE